MDYTQLGGSEEPNRKRLPFPPDTKAFLYYYMSPEKPRIAGELRFRLASSDDAASFESGSDLLLTNGQPWSRPLYILPKSYFPLYEMLREEGLVPVDLDRALSTFSTRHHYRGRRRIYTLNETFIVDFNNNESSFTVITEQGIDVLPFFDIFRDPRRDRKSRPFTGAHTKFESPCLASLILNILMNL